MNAKWYVGTLIIILAVLGLSQGPKKASNQQIVFQFTDIELASERAHDQVLAAIIQQLQTLGIHDVEVLENDETQLRIRYYSDVDALKIKAFLCQEHQLSLAYEHELPSDFPKEQLPETYKLIVVDLHQQADNGYGLHGNLVSAQNEDHRSFYPVTPLIKKVIIDLGQDALIGTVLRINPIAVIASDNTAHQIPEVRAGPCA